MFKNNIILIDSLIKNSELLYVRLSILRHRFPLVLILSRSVVAVAREERDAHGAKNDTLKVKSYLCHI